MKELMPKNVKNIKKYRGKIPLFHDANIEKELNIQELKQDIHNEKRMKELEKDE